MRRLTNILVTGGAGFIGSNFIRYLFEKEGFSGTVVNADCLTYAGKEENLADVEAQFGKTVVDSGATQRYFFEKADICNRDRMERIFRQYDIDTVIHFAAESHVDRSICGPEAFIRTNVMGTQTLLDTARFYWLRKDGVLRDDVLFHQISTDEVYGSLGIDGSFTEESPYEPRSPYAASKAAADHLVMAYHYTYGLPVTISHCSNNYGPCQFPEKFLPLVISNIRDGKELPVYGDGRNIRDWIYVDDHIRAVWLIVNKGKTGGRYNISGENEWRNIDLLHKVIELTAAECGLNPLDVEKTIRFVSDRPGHDRRYALDCSKLKDELGWKQTVNFEEGLRRTVSWYVGKDKYQSVFSFSIR
ncbi:MAG: dTDP-glucose 4,6-dehydratase [Treponema sp.]|nr:dTDP-glucose 4,6-dehydratase [Candidatus Treponema caballi]